MKKNKIYTLWLILFSLGFTGCSEEEVNLRLEEQGCVLTKVEQVGIFTETYIYNESGNITLVTRTDGNGNAQYTTRAFYDLKGRLSYALTYLAGETNPYSKIIFSYNEKGQMVKYNYFLITQEATDVKQFTFKYDDQGRLTFINYYDRGDARESVRYEYFDDINTIQEFEKYVNSPESPSAILEYDRSVKNPFYAKNFTDYFITSGASIGGNNFVIFYLSEFAAAFRGNQSFTYEYNEQGYPTKITTNFGVSTNLEYTCK